ncbi:FtsX-like permease family protein [Pedobacter frigidisoli]|uniref:FtsX-like permease family protein n=1 Tax=Pedobacter frigidisoli TaxID=2530455 RepID=A0A4V2ML07_9SPHI|nr:ABC transporter permease [Pedobacter frigidisoli]TCD00007.1 FtsX-like permease family protein [Pedobacter frigidisoli]
MFRLNLKIALRNLWKNKGFSLINIGGLAIGLASCMILLLYVVYEFGYDKQYKNYKSTYIAYTNMKANGKTFSWAWTPGLLSQELKENVTGVSNSARSSYPISLLIGNGENKLKNKGMFVDPAYLKIFDFDFIDGTSDNILQNINTVILTKSLAKKLFGNHSSINKIVKLDNLEPLKVEAVIDDIPQNSSLTFDYLMPWKLYEKRETWTKKQGWGSNFCLTVVQLQNSNTLAQVNTSIKDLFHRMDKDQENELFLHPLSKWHLYGDFENGKSVGGKISQLKIFLLLAICILLIACVNFMNLSTSRSEKRAKEVGVRKAIGSSRKSLISQFILESTLLSFIGTVVAFILLEISLPYFNNLLNINLIIQYNDWRYWLTLICLILFTGLIAGSYPAFYLSSFEPVKVLKGFSIKAGSAFSVRKVLVVFQFVFASCLIVCTSVIYQQLNYIKNKPLGYNSNGLVQLSAEGNLKNLQKINLLRERLVKAGAVTNVSTLSMSLSNGGNNTSGISWPGKNPNTSVLFNNRAIGYDFVETIGAKMVEGRSISKQFEKDSNSVIFNEAGIKAMGMKNPIGKKIKWDTGENVIVGVMKDFVIDNPFQKVEPMILYSAFKDNVSVILLKLNPSANVTASLSKIDEIVKEINPDYPIDREFVNQSFEQKFENEKLLGTLSNWFGGFAIFISCLGLLGLALFMAEQRKKEISIRKVLGASTGNILTLLNKDFIKLVAIANVIAFPLAYVIINQWLSAFEYRVAISFLPFSLAIVISVLIAILTVSIQSIKVAKANPIDALKYE